MNNDLHKWEKELAQKPVETGETKTKQQELYQKEIKMKLMKQTRRQRERETERG